MTDFKYSNKIDEVLVSSEAKRLQEMSSEHRPDKQALTRIFSFLDFTTLEGSDNPSRIAKFCEKALQYGQQGVPLPAAVCIYPPFIRTAKEVLRGTPVKVATTAAAFPSGQMSLKVKLAEVEYALEEGADEVDIVISRGTFLEGNYDVVADEIAQMKSLCRDKTLKVILETGELRTVENITRASELAILAGADFIKTSTGKVTPAATPEAVIAMLFVIRSYFEKTGIRIGIKPAGGIADAATAYMYYTLIKEIPGESWLTPDLFRIGASRLADNLSTLILTP